MRIILTVGVLFFFLSCKKDTSNNVTQPPSNDTTYHSIYPYKETYSGTMHLESYHEADTITYNLDTFFQNPPVTVEHISSDSFVVTFGYWECTSAKGYHQLYYGEVMQYLTSSSNGIYTYDQHYSHRYSRDTLQNDSLVFYSSNSAGPTFHETIHYRGIKRH